MLRRWSILNCSVSVVIVLLMKCEPWSLIKVIEHPNLVIMFSYMNLAATSLEQVSTGSPSAHLVTYSIVVMIYLAPVLFIGTGNGPIKLIAHISNVRLGFTDIKGISVLGSGRPRRWQQSHFLTKFLQSLYSVGHHSLNCWILFAVVSD